MISDGVKIVKVMVISTERVNMKIWKAMWNLRVVKLLVDDCLKIREDILVMVKMVMRMSDKRVHTIYLDIGQLGLHIYIIKHFNVLDLFFFILSIFLFH